MCTKAYQATVLLRDNDLYAVHCYTMTVRDIALGYHDLGVPLAEK